MHNKRLVGLAASLIVAVGGACSSDEEVATEATTGTFVAPVVDGDAVADTALWYDGFYDPLTGVFIGQVTVGDGGILGDGGVVLPTTRIPRPLDGLFGSWGVVLNAGCVPSVPTAVDNDGDGVPGSYAATFNCMNVTVGNRTSSVTGSVAIADADDNLKNSGFSITYTNFVVSTTLDGRTRTRTLNGTSVLTLVNNVATSANNYTLVFDFQELDGTRTQGTYIAMNGGSYTPDASVGSDFFASGTVNLTGTGTLQRTINGTAETRTVTRSTDPQLHWNRSCRTQNSDSLGYDSGVLLYQDMQGSKLQLTFNGCTNPTVKRD